MAGFAEMRSLPWVAWKVAILVDGIMFSLGNLKGRESLWGCLRCYAGAKTRTEQASRGFAPALKWAGGIA